MQRDALIVALGGSPDVFKTEAFVATQDTHYCQRCASRDHNADNCTVPAFAPQRRMQQRQARSEQNAISRCLYGEGCRLSKQGSCRLIHPGENEYSTAPIPLCKFKDQCFRNRRGNRPHRHEPIVTIANRTVAAEQQIHDSTPMFGASEAKNDTDNRVPAQRTIFGPANPPPNTESATADSTPVYSQAVSMDDEVITSDEDEPQVTTSTPKYSMATAATESKSKIKRGLHDISGGTPKKPQKQERKDPRK
jgi:hypothetical protein